MDDRRERGAEPRRGPREVVAPGARNVRATTRIARAALPAAALLGATAPATAQVFQSDETHDGFLGSLGFSVAQLGDYDGDGHEDFIVGEPLADSSSGIVWVFSGADGSVLDSHDGHVDMLVGAPGAGRVLLDSIYSPSHSCVVGTGGTLLVSPLLSIPLAIPDAGMGSSGAIPDDPAPCGVDVDLQALEIDPGASNGVSFTDGLDLTLGGA